MTISEFLQSARVEVGVDGDHLGVELLLAFVLGESREFLLVHSDSAVSELQREHFFELFNRMIKGEPVAYLLGKKEFYGLDFFVDKRVLIPRPETEHLVERVLNYVGSAPAESVRILDVGTGSGCIAVSLAKHLSSAQVTGVDISEEALEVAKINAQQNGVLVEFLQSDLLGVVEKPFDIIVANLPYIGEKRFNFVSKSASDYEPHVALFGGDDGLGLYRKFFEQLSQKIEKNHWSTRLLLGEFGFLQRDELEVLFYEFFPDVKITFEQDYAHIDRLFVVEFPYV